MKALKLSFVPLVAATCVALLAMPANAENYRTGSDTSFNEMAGQMAGRDTGSGWFDYYVARLNQKIAASENSPAYGAAGPNGPLDGFTGYVAGFRNPDTGSRWFNNYVDTVNADIQQKQAY